jgi:large subunit ribosomal protein L21
MYAIIQESGSQRKVTQGETILIDLLEEGGAEAGKKVTFDKVLVVGEVGGNAKVGQPYVAGASVTAEVVDPTVLGEKVWVQKFREKKTWKKRVGHRQRFTRVKVTGIKG